MRPAGGIGVVYSGSPITGYVIENLVTDADEKVVVFDSAEEMRWVLRQGDYNVREWTFVPLVGLDPGTRRKFRNSTKGTK